MSAYVTLPSWQPLMEDHAARARQLLTAYRRANEEADPSASPGLRNRKSKETAYTYKEVNHVLAEIVDQDGSANLVKALLGLGGDVNYTRRRSTNLWKKVARKDQEPERNVILEKATRHSRAEVVEALAAHADQQNLDLVLHSAISRGDLNIIRILLAKGADPVDLHDDFEQAVVNSDRDLVAVLLSGAKLPCLHCRSTGLAIAVETEDPYILRLLIGKSADVNYNQADALVRAVSSKKTDYVSLLVAGPVPPSSETLEIAIATAWKTMAGNDSKQEVDMIDTCIRAGARGPETDRLLTEGLVDAVRRKQRALVDVLLKHTSLVDPHQTLAIVEAIKGYQRGMLLRFLNLRPSQNALSSGLSHAMSVKDSAVRIDFVQLLLATGVPVRPVAEALIHAVRLLAASARHTNANTTSPESKLVEMLLDLGKADINHNRGEALQIAISAGLADAIRNILGRNPSQEALEAALPVALSIQDSSQVLVVVDLILGTGFRGNVVDQCLVEAIQGGHDKSYLVELLLTRASVSYNGGAALMFAIRNQDLNAVRLLLKQRPDGQALFSALQVALKLPRHHREPYITELLPHLRAEHLSEALKQLTLEPSHDLTLIRIILEAGAPVSYNDDFCLRHAATNFDVPLLELVSRFAGANEALYSLILEDLVRQGEPWNTKAHFDTICLLLQHGASGGAVDCALLHAVRTLGDGKEDRHIEELVKVLLDCGADVNFQQGLAAALAAKYGYIRLLTLMLKARLTASNAVLAFTSAVDAGHSEARLLEIINLFAREKMSIVFGSEYREGGCLHHVLGLYPSATALIRRLIEVGSAVEHTARQEVFAEYDQDTGGADNFGDEEVSVLLWALLQPDNKIRSDVVGVIIDGGANTNFTTQKSRTTPLIVAAKFGRADIVDRLLRNGANHSARDALGRSALFYASRIGDSKSVALLLQKKMPIDDGSLHEACRGFYAEVVEQLLEAGHDPNYPSTKHGGRTALGEVALHGIVPDDIGRAEDATDLLKAKADPLIQVHGKSAIFLALDNRDAQRMTRLLLDRVLWKYLNNEANVFQEGGLHYSPSMYVTKGLFQGPYHQADALLWLLKGEGAVDRYYASMDLDQPEDAVGLPDDIREIEKEKRAWQRRRDREEEDHKIELRRKDEQAQQRARIADGDHSAELQRSEAAAAQRRRNKGLDHNQDVQIEAEKHHNWASIRISEANVESKIGWQQHSDHRSMRQDMFQQALGHRQGTYQQQVGEAVQNHAMEIRFKENRHIQDYQHKADNRGQDYRHKAYVNVQERQQKYANDKLQLQYDGQKMQQQVWMQRQLAADETRHQQARDWIQERKDFRALQGQKASAMADGYRHRLKMAEMDVEGKKIAGSHRIKMAEMEAERMRMAGEVNLAEWKAWKQSQVPQPPQRKMIQGS